MDYVRTMSSRPAEQTASHWIHAPLINAARVESGRVDPETYDTGNSAPPPPPMTSIGDDEYTPEDEHDGENEAEQHETSDAEEAPEEFSRDDEDSRGP
jgi:hypothetical protein